jgi:hypothetical protein
MTTASEPRGKGPERRLGSCEPGKTQDANHYLKDNQRGCGGNEDLASLRFERIRENSSDERE